jgi:hypothetical protein
MTFWQFITNIWVWIEAHATRAIGTVLGTITVLVGTGIVPDKDLKYATAVIAVLTYWRGQSITNTVSAAKAIVGANTAAELTKGPPK